MKSGVHRGYQVAGRDSPTAHFLGHISGACRNLRPTDTVLLLRLSTIQYFHDLSVHHGCEPVHLCQSGVQNLYESPEGGDCIHSEVGSLEMLESAAPLDTGLSSSNHSSFDSRVTVGLVGVDLGKQVGAVGGGMVVFEILDFAVRSVFEDDATGSE